MKLLTTLITAATAATLLSTPSTRAADTSPTQSGSVKTSSTQPDETLSERIIRAAGDQTKSLALPTYNVNWKVLAGGGSVGSSSSFVVGVTLGQPVTGLGSAEGLIVRTGFWQQFGAASCCLRRGDMDRSGTYTVADLTFLVNFIASSGEPPGCLEEGDVDASGELNIADLTYLVAFIFRGGPLPPPC